MKNNFIPYRKGREIILEVIYKPIKYIRFRECPEITVDDSIIQGKSEWIIAKLSFSKDLNQIFKKYLKPLYYDVRVKVLYELLISNNNFCKGFLKKLIKNVIISGKFISILIL